MPGYNFGAHAVSDIGFVKTLLENKPLSDIKILKKTKEPIPYSIRVVWNDPNGPIKYSLVSKPISRDNKIILLQNQYHENRFF
jgi:hypothetical protein